MTTRIQVDKAVLRTLATRIGTVRSDLEGAKTDFQDDEALQSAAIGHALSGFTGSWSQQRAALVRVLQLAEDQVRHVAEAFSLSDVGLANALDGEPASTAVQLANHPTY